MLARLPESVDDLFPKRFPERRLLGLGVLRKCYCGTVIIDSEQFAAAARHYWKVRCKRAEVLSEQLKKLVENSGVDTGAFNSPWLCSHCDVVFTKDD
jgi:hypothetical protein